MDKDERSLQFVIGGVQLTADKRSSNRSWTQNESVERVTLSGTAHHQRNSLDDLQAVMKKGNPVIVVDGTGHNLGKFYIINIRDNGRELMDDSRTSENQLCS